MKRILCLFVLFLFSKAVTYSQNSDLDLSKIMAGNEFIGIQPDNINWSPNSNEIYFHWDKKNTGILAYYKYNLDQKKVEKIQPITTGAQPVEGHFYNDDRSIIYFKQRNSLYTWSKKNGTKLIYSSLQPYQILKIDSNGKILLRIDNNLFYFNRDNSSFIQLTNFIAKDEETKEESTLLINQQKELFEIQKSRNLKKENREKEDELYFRNFHTTIYIGENELDWVEYKKGGTRVIYETTKYPKNEATKYPSFITKNGHTQLKIARPKVGAKNPEHSLFLYKSHLKKSEKIDISKLSGIFDKPEYLHAIYNDTVLKLELPKEVIYHTHGFNESNRNLIVEIKSYDNKDRWITLLNMKGELIEIDHQHNDAWIGGPGISGWNMVPGNIGWIDEYTLFYQSEESAYSHLYAFNIQTKQKQQLTSGEFEIHEANLSVDKSKFFITANKSHPGNRDFLTLDIATQKITNILSTDGNHEVTVSPDEKWLAIRYSSKNMPWDLYIAPFQENTQMTRLTDSRTKEFKSYNWRNPEIITYKAADSQLVHARIYEPKPEIKNGAAIIFVHGAGYLQNAHNWWSGYYREYMFNNLLTDKGYTVLDIDYRASKGYGRDFRTDIYRHMGGKDLSDHMDGRQHLIKEYNIDSNRIGMYGGSYGGFITLMALLTEPGKIKCGAAIRSVTDWAHYNHEYTSNILNTPAMDPESYVRSSPIYYAKNLADKLLMLHGMEDNNVQYQDVVRLSQRFIETGKKNWDLVGYPIEPHGFKETSSWIDEYGRILDLFDKELAKEQN